MKGAVQRPDLGVGSASQVPLRMQCLNYPSELRKRSTHCLVILVVCIVILSVAWVGLPSAPRHQRAYSSMSLTALPSVATFSPENVRWFHAVNSEVKLHAAIKAIQTEHSQNRTDDFDMCFGLEVDVRSISNTLILSHDPPVVGYLSNLVGRAFGLDSMLHAVQAGVFKDADKAPPIIIKLDVKDETALATIANDIITSINGQEATHRPIIPPWLFLHTASRTTGFPRTQVWLNYDVVPFVSNLQPVAADSRLVQSFKGVADAIRRYYLAPPSPPRVVTVGFSLGWVSTPEGSRYCSSHPSSKDPVYGHEHYSAMQSFLGNVFPLPTEHPSPTAYATTTPFVLTLALRFSLVDYAALRAFVAQIRDLWSSGAGVGGNTSLLMFPTLWRGRTEVISKDTRHLLETEARQHEMAACVDQE